MKRGTTELGGATANVSRDFRAEMDARHLTAAQGIRLDEKRHQAALKHMKKKAGSIQGMLDMEAKVKKGLAAAFPKEKEPYAAGKGEK